MWLLQDTEWDTHDFRFKICCLQLTPQKAAPALPWGAQLCLVCELRVSVYSSLCIHSRSISHSLCAACQWLIRCWMGSSGPSPRSQAKNFISFWLNEAVNWNWFPEGKSLFLKHCQSQFPTSGILIAYQAAVCIFCCPTCLNLSPYDPSACSLSAMEQSIFQEGVLYRHIRARFLIVWKWYSDSNLFWHQKL